MRFHVRRLALFVLGATCAFPILFSVLRPHDDVQLPAMPQVAVERRPLRPLSLDERLAKYSSGGAGGSVNNLSGFDYEMFGPPRGLFTLRRRQSKEQQSNGEVAKEEDDLMSESVSGSQNELTRRQYVQLPENAAAAGALWWSSSSENPDDRIRTQMRHVPRGYDGQTLKTIYMPDGLGNEPEGREKFLSEQCPVNACTLTSDRSVARTAEMRLLQGDSFFQFVEKPAGQIWTMFLLESPANTGLFPKAGDFINWTATYRWDSTIVTPYEKFVPYRNATTGLRDRAKSRRSRRLSTTARAETNRQATRRNYAAGKTKMVAWFVSNCGPKNRRNDYALELMKYVQVDVYGACGTLKCPRKEADLCQKLLNADYKFYLSFENSNCDYYITEKFYENGLQNDVVPIVMGGRKEDYARAAPPHSYIHVEDFPTAKDLAKYLHRLDQSDELYNEYFAWKGTGEFINTKFWCRLCAMLHDDDKPVMWYSDFHKWWIHKGACRVDRWDTTAS